jgi:hypothetical protein
MSRLQNKSHIVNYLTEGFLMGNPNHLSIQRTIHDGISKYHLNIDKAFYDKIKEWLLQDILFEYGITSYDAGVVDTTNIFYKFYDDNTIKCIHENCIDGIMPATVAAMFISCGGVLEEEQRIYINVRQFGSHVDYLIQSFEKRWGIRFYKDTHYIVTQTHSDTVVFCTLIEKYFRDTCLCYFMPLFFEKHGRMAYLSGGQQFAASGGVHWRSDVTAALYRIGYDAFNPAFDPTGAYDIYGHIWNDFDSQCEVGAYFIDTDKTALEKCDIMICYWDESVRQGGGTKPEITWAYEMGIPIYLVLAANETVEKLPIWIKGAVWNRDNIFDVGTIDARWNALFSKLS